MMEDLKSERLGLELAGVVILLAVGLCLSVATVSGEPSAGDLEMSVRQWVRLRAQIAEETQEWRGKEPQLRREIKLLKIESDSLEKEIEGLGEQDVSLREEIDRLAARGESLKSGLTGLLPVLDAAEGDLRGFRKLIPPSLLAPLASAFDRLPEAGQAIDVPAARRLQLIVSLHSHIETLHSSVNVVTEILPIESGLRREVDILYLGLAGGFAVSRDNRWAARGTPTIDGWRWEAEPAIAGDVRRAIAVFNHEQEATLVPLPLRVWEVAP